MLTVFILLTSLVFHLRCATLVSEAPNPTPEAPAFAAMTHPSLGNLSELSQFLQSPGAQEVQARQTSCEAPIQALIQKKLPLGEFHNELQMLVRNHPVDYHWCFYLGLEKVERLVKEDLFIEEKQKQFIDRFEVLAPLARAFYEAFNDPRYLRFSAALYQKWSPSVLSRKVELTPRGSANLLWSHSLESNSPEYVDEHVGLTLPP